MKQSFSLTKIISVLLLAAVLLSVSSCKRVEPQISDKKVSLDISVHSEDDAASMIYLFLCPQGASGKDDIKKLIITRNSENSWNVENDYGQEELNDIGEHGRLYAIYTEGKQRAFEESADGWGISGSGYGETQTCGTDYSIRNRCLSADIRLEKTGTQILISHLDTDDGWELSTAQDGSVRKLNAISNISVSRNGIILKCGESTICGQTKSDTEVFHIGKDEYDTKPLVITLKNLRNGKSYSRNFGETALRGKDACELEGPELDADGAFINSHGWEQSHEDRNKIFYRLHPSSAKLEGYAEGEGKDMFAAKITAHNYDPETGYGEIIFDSPVTKIGTDAFMEQSSIVSLTIPETVTSLDERAFALCPSLESINIPSGVTSFGRGLFYGCESLTSIDIPDGITEINDLVFQYCTSLSKVDIPQGVTRIGIQAFAVCTGLTDIHIPGKVTSIADCAFAECTGLTEITLPEGLKTIGNAAFGGCSNMESFNIPETVSEISAQAFYYCDKLKSINIPYGITSIEEQLFCECRSLSDISLPETVTSIHQAAFASCTSLTSVRLAGELTTAGSYIFDDCPALSSFEGPNASADGRCLIIKDTLVAFAPKGIKDYRIPEEVVYFSFKPIVSDEIETISMSDNVLGVQGDVYMFIQLPKLREITLSARIADVGINFCCDCPSLTKVYLRAPLPPAVGYRSENDDTGLSVYVPRESLELYKSSGNWTFWKEQFKAYDYSDLPSDINTDFYCSTDYSRDGQVSTFQTATEGNGIDLVFMGDAFSDRQIADGTYRDAMQKGIEAFFSIEPYKSFRHLFNVQIVDVVSRNEGYNYYAPALGTHFSDNTYIELDDTCIDYICKAVPEEHLNEVTTVILMNSDRYAGTCYEFIPDEQSDYGQGFSIALLPIMSYNYENLMHHEAGGHGFAKLLDEYAYEENGKAPDSIIDELRSFSQIGWGKNLDITDDPEKVKWAHFLTDSRYKSEGLGVFEGGRTYNKGVWRSTEESMMNHNIGNFNAPSREAIYYRIHKLAYGKDWKYNYEDFVCYDAVSRAGFSAETSNKKMTHSAETSVRNTAHTPPVIMDKNWRVIKNKK